MTDDVRTSIEIQLSEAAKLKWRMAAEVVGCTLSELARDAVVLYIDTVLCAAHRDLNTVLETAGVIEADSERLSAMPGRPLPRGFTVVADTSPKGVFT
jgi:hypothetical protein